MSAWHEPGARYTVQTVWGFAITPGANYGRSRARQEHVTAYVSDQVSGRTMGAFRSEHASGFYPLTRQQWAIENARSLADRLNEEERRQCSQIHAT